VGGVTRKRLTIRKNLKEKKGERIPQSEKGKTEGEERETLRLLPFITT